MDGVKILSDLISIDTSVPPGANYDKLIAYLKPILQELLPEVEEILIPPEYTYDHHPRKNILAHHHDPTKPRLIFYSHIDTVPAQGWEYTRPIIEDGKIYGRGAADMKGSLVAFLLALEKIKDREPKFDISLMVTTDEEIGQADQLRYLKSFLEPVKGAYIFDLDSSFGYVSITGLGAIHMSITVKGKSVHSAMSHMGKNAVEGACQLANSLLELKKEVLKRKSCTPAAPDSGLEKMEPRLNINLIQGGLKVNIVPDECHLAIDRRLIPEEDITSAEDEIKKALDGLPDVEWEITNIFRIPPVPPLEDPLVDQLADIIYQVTGKTGKYGEMGSGDLGHIANFEWQAKHFGLGVIRPECSIHGRNEFVYINDIEDLATIIARFLLEWA